jgi:peroxin-19
VKSTASTDPSEEEFMAHLNAEMSALIANMSHDPAASTTSPEQLGQMGKELEQFTERMEKEGVKPEDLLRAILGEEDAEKVVDKAAEMRKQSESEGVDEKSEGSSKPKLKAAAVDRSTSRDEKTTTAAAAGTNTTFEDTIRRTMERMSTSDATATNAASQSANSEEDMLAQLLKAMETEGGGADGGDGDLSKMFLGMMEQLTNKDMLYEPMKELDEKFPAWLVKKEQEGQLPAEDMKRYRNQREIVREIVGKFEERGYSDEDARCRDFIWERMQKMQNEGSPPEDLIANPFPGMGGLPGLGAGGGGGEGGEDAGCPTQ